MKRIKFTVLLLALFLGLGTGAMAATSALNNAPGGAGVAQWMVGPDGTETLLNIQNTAAMCAVDPAYIMVHVTFYDRDSNHLFDVRWPMSPRDNLGIAMSGDGTNVNLVFEPGEPDETNHMFTSAGIGADQMQFGYVTVAVTAVDDRNGACYQRIAPHPNFWMPVGNGDGDPTNDQDASALTRDVVLPDILFIRAAILSPAGFLNGVLGLNGVMLQGFANMRILNENANADFTNVTGADAQCNVAVDWDNDGFVNVTPSVDNNGVDIGAHELYMTVNHTDNGADFNVEIALQMIAAGAGACTRAGRIASMGSQIIPIAAGPVPLASGSTNNQYWARFNVTPGLTDTNLVLVFPANSPTPFNNAHLIADPRTFSVLAYDDDEHPVSTPGLSGPEFVIAPFSSATNPPLPGMPVIQHSVYTHGEALLWTLGRVPMFGYVYTTVNGVGADIYPLEIEGLPVNVANVEGADLDNAGVNVDIISLP